jgi:hypothetical protein
MRQRGLADAGHVLDQQMAARQQAGHAVFDLGTFADDDRGDLVHEARDLARYTRIH